MCLQGSLFRFLSFARIDVQGYVLIRPCVVGLGRVYAGDPGGFDVRW
jgi:hypothetical protein